MPPPSRVPAILPPPFAWIDIPAGEVTLLNDWDEDEGVYLQKDQPQTFAVPAFAIAKYPVTNAQYARFIKAGGVDDRKWWIDAGWTVREEKLWTEPRFWQDATWNGADCPVVGVSWYEALAFCVWLTEISGQTILLPSEQQWQRAAQGDDGRAYPWGNEWECTRSNNSVPPCDSNHTSSVKQYEGWGDSPFGVTDMAGNVWEWCLTGYKTGRGELDREESRVARGGSGDYVNASSFRVLERNWFDPDYDDNNIGFRIVLAR